MKLSDLYSHTGHGYNRSMLYTVFPKVWQKFLGEEPWGVSHIIQDNYAYLKKYLAWLIYPNSKLQVNSHVNSHEI